MACMNSVYFFVFRYSYKFRYCDTALAEFCSKTRSEYVSFTCISCIRMTCTTLLSSHKFDSDPIIDASLIDITASHFPSRTLSRKEKKRNFHTRQYQSEKNWNTRSEHHLNSSLLQQHLNSAEQIQLQNLAENSTQTQLHFAKRLCLAVHLRVLAAYDSIYFHFERSMGHSHLDFGTNYHLFLSHFFLIAI